MEPLNLLELTLSEGSNSFTIAATDASSNISAKSDALVITLDTADPVFATSTDATDVTLGDTVPTLSTLCTDANATTVTIDAGSATFDAERAKTILYTCTDAAGNTATQSVSYSVAVPDTTKPVYSGPSRFDIIQNSHFGNFNARTSGVECTDDTDGSITAVPVQGGFPTNTIKRYLINYTCTDDAGNHLAFLTQYFVIAQPIVSMTIGSVPSSTGSDSIDVSITFGEDVTGFETGDIRVTNSAGHALSGTGSSYTLTITPTQDGTITVTIPRGAAQAGSAINAVASFSFVSDRAAPAIPTYISIASDNADSTKAKLGNIVTITFDTEEGSTVEGTIGGGTATFAFNGTSSTLTRTLNGTESPGVLAFSFVQTDATSNDAAAPQTAVKGTGSAISVTADFAAPVVTNAGSSYANTSQGSSYTLPTMTCDDNIDADKDILPPVTFHTINAGTNVIYYQCSDAAGNESNRFAFTVNVVQVTPPTSTITTLRAENGANATQSISLELIGKYPIYYISLLNPYTAPELSCVEDTDGTLNRFDPQLLPSSTTIKHHTAGDYPQHYQCAGTQGTNNYNVIVTVHEIATINEIRSGADVLFLDTAPKPVRYYTAPIDEDFIKHVPQKSVSYSTAPLTMTFSGYPKIESLISLYDDNTSQTHPVMTSVVHAADKANIEYTFTPTSGANPHISIRIDGFWGIDDDYLLIHDSDISGPDLSLIGDSVMSIEPSTSFTEPGYTCTDSTDSSVDVIISGAVNTNKVGLYNLSYSCTDSDNQVDTKHRSVYVTSTASSDNGPPSSHSPPTKGVDSHVTFDASSDSDPPSSHSPPTKGVDSHVTFDASSDSGPPEPIEEPKKKKSGGYNDWHKKPTFGISHLTYKQIVDNGFSFNGYSLTVTDNWHTDFVKTSSVIGESNTVKIKTYAADPLKWINLYLGVPRLGNISDAESEIQLVVSRDYNNPVDYTIDEINHYQDEGLVNVDDTTASLQKVKCQASDKDKKCYEFTINFTVMAPLHEEVVAISAMDEKRRQHVTYINEGVEFTGTSLLDAHTAQLMQKKTNQGDVEFIELTQQDRRYNVWEDQHGYLWTLNEYGTWTQITAADFEHHQDGTGNVMTRQNSNFASLIEQERQKALLVFDSGDLISELDDYFAYDYSNVTSDMSKLEKYAYELQLESERAQKYSSNSD